MSNDEQQKTWRIPIYILIGFAIFMALLIYVMWPTPTP